MKLTSILTGLTLLSLNSLTHAGVVGGNGGFVIQCENLPLLVLDYYQATLPTVERHETDVLFFDEKNLEETKKEIQRRINALPSFSYSILNRYKRVADIREWKLANLAPFEDDTEMAYEGCSKPYRVAYRQNGQVFLQKGIERKLDAGQMYLLSLHEWFYESSQKKTSASTRLFFSELIKGMNTFDQSKLNTLAQRQLLSRWVPLTYNDFEFESSTSTLSLTDLCRSKGAEFDLAVTGRVYGRRIFFKSLTCAKLID